MTSLQSDRTGKTTWRWLFALIIVCTAARLSDGQYRELASVPTGNFASPSVTLSGDYLYFSTSGASLVHPEIWSLRTDGSELRRLHVFGSDANLRAPEGELHVEGDLLFGAVAGNVPGLGAVNSIFRMQLDGTGYQYVSQVGNTVFVPRAVYGRFLRYGDRLYNNFSGNRVFSFDLQGGDFRLAPTGVFVPNAPWIGDDTDTGLTEYNGRLYGTTFAAISPATGGRLYSIEANLTDYREQGIVPYGSTGELLVVGDRFFGTTGFIGTGSAARGTIYSIRPDGTDMRIHHAFQESDPGRIPLGPLVQVGSRLYGTTAAGVAGSTIYSIDLEGNDFQYATDFVLPFPLGSANGPLAVRGDTLYGTLRSTSPNRTIVFAYTVPEPQLIFWPILGMLGFEMMRRPTCRRTATLPRYDYEGADLSC